MATNTRSATGNIKLFTERITGQASPDVFWSGACGGYMTAVAISDLF